MRPMQGAVQVDIANRENEELVAASALIEIGPATAPDCARDRCCDI